MSENTNILTDEYGPFQKFKVLCWYERMKKIKTGNFAPPVNIALDICQGTQDKKLCGKGFNCKPCMSNLEDQSEEAYIPRDILFQIPEFYNKWGVKSICLAGHHSDPVMYPHRDLIDFLRLCNRWNIEVGFVSNGAYFNKHLLEEVARTCVWSGWSINAGDSESHQAFSNTPKGTFDKIINNIKYMYDYCKEYNLNHDIGYKYLIAPYNYKAIYSGIELASKIGVRHFQIRPCELPEEESKKIDVEEVEKQIKLGLRLEREREFNVYGIREKFTPDFKKRVIERCMTTPLGSTWMANGMVAPCPDRRWSVYKPNMNLGNFIDEGLEAIRRKWGGAEHIAMLKEINKNVNNCIRCTSYSWIDLYKNTIESDPMNVKLI